MIKSGRIKAILILLFFISGCSDDRKSLYFFSSWSNVMPKENQEIRKPSQIESQGVVTNKKAVKLRKSHAKKEIGGSKLKRHKPATKHTKLSKHKQDKKPEVMHKNQQKGLQTVVIAASRPRTTKFNVAGSICKFINARQDKLNIRCLVEPTSGVTESLKKSSRYDFIVSQTNLEYQILQADKNTKLRSVFSLYPETFTLITSKNSGIRNLSDLKGKKVYIGYQKSSAELAFARVLNSVGLDIKTDVQLVRGVNMARQLCDNSIDVIFTGVVHPDPDIHQMITRCRAKILPLQGPYFDNLIAQYDEYIEAEILLKDKALKTFGIMTNLIATQKASDDVVYKITKAVFEEIEAFKLQDPNLLEITKEDMAVMNEGLILPIAKGAEKYYKEVNIKHNKS